MCLISLLCGKDAAWAECEQRVLRVLGNDEGQSTDPRGTMNSYPARPK